MKTVAANGGGGGLSERWIGSRFLARSRDEQGNLVLYSSYTGHIMKVTPDEADLVRRALKDGVEGHLSGTLASMQQGGFLVPAGVDERRRAKLLHDRWKARKETAELIVLPTEACNFRCVYCYESFAVGKMSDEIQTALGRHVDLKVQSLERLVVGWFGGEPLLALDVVESLSTSFMTSCWRTGVQYVSTMTTNGYLLTREVAERLRSLGVRHYQITLDGPSVTHDERRVLAETREGTFETILANLVEIADSDLNVGVTVRVNFDPGNKDLVPDLLGELHARFQGDSRFAVHFHPVSKLGGPQDALLELCSPEEAFDLYERAVTMGWPVQTLSGALEPCGSVCYAANPNSLVIGSDGKVYKCTVALADPANHIGQLLANGQLDLNDDRLALWITGGESEDEVCQDCFLRPSCQGNVCPWRRISQGARYCPPTKSAITRIVRMVAEQR